MNENNIKEISNKSKAASKCNLTVSSSSKGTPKDQQNTINYFWTAKKDSDKNNEIKNKENNLYGWDSIKGKG